MHCIQQTTIVASLLCLLAWQSALALVVVPQTNVPSNSAICAPSTLPETFLPSDFATCFQDVAAARGKPHPEMNKRTEEVIAMRGYPVTMYNVTTPDGYILTLHRIPGSPNSPPASGKQPVFIIHGLVSSSSTWFLLGGNRDLPMKLADAGYDVWLGNSRGSSYSLGHTKYNSSVDTKYWEFSWHELGIQDVPTVTSEILNITGQAQIMYVGHSMGTTQYFVALSTLPEMNNKIRAAVLLAPVAYMGHANNALRVLGPVTATQAQTSLPNVLSKIPDNTSFKTLVHYGQSMNKCAFRQYDYGMVGNIRKYGNAEPPTYNITKITAPTYLIHGDRDNFAQPIDVEITKSHMRPETVKDVIRVNWDLFNHFDFVMAKDADTLVYDKVVDILNSNLAPAAE